MEDHRKVWKRYEIYTIYTQNEEHAKQIQTLLHQLF